MEEKHDNAELSDDDVDMVLPKTGHVVPSTDFKILVDSLQDKWCFVQWINMFWVLTQTKRAYLAPKGGRFKSFFDAHQSNFKRKNLKKEDECLLLRMVAVKRAGRQGEWQFWVIHSHDLEAFDKAMFKARQKMTDDFIGTMMGNLQPNLEGDTVPGQISWIVNDIEVCSERVHWQSLSKEAVNEKFDALDSTLPPGTGCVLKIETKQ